MHAGYLGAGVDLIQSIDLLTQNLSFSFTNNSSGFTR